MTNIEMLYLILVTAAMTIFVVGLAYAAWAAPGEGQNKR